VKDFISAMHLGFNVTDDEKIAEEKFSSISKDKWAA
jgi:hypothetical protein